MDLFAFIDRTEPGSPTSTTHTAISLSPFEDPSARSVSQLKQLGRTVYKDVWNEFYDWEPGYCAEILGTVTQSLLASKRQVARVAKAMVARLLLPEDDDAHHARVPDGTDVVVTSVTHFDVSPARPSRGPVRGRTTDVPIPVVTIGAYKPHPKYESCPPVSRSVLADAAQEHTLFFLPYADDDRFAARAYQAKFDTLEWETPFDPDVEMIQIETFKRLLAMHEVDAGDIDRMKMFTELRVSHNTGLQWEQSQRDVVHWPGASRFEATQEEQLPNYTPDPDDLRQRLMSNLRTFCPSINCLHSVCETHGQKHASINIPSGKPQMTGKNMILSEGAPCGPDCFRHIQDFERFMETLPPSPSKSHHTGSLDTLETVLGIAPDLFPCQLAIICLKPCKQVFVQRLQLFPDHTILPATLSSISGDSLMDTDTGGLQQRKKTKERLKFVDEVNTSCDLLEACAHPGSCTMNNCKCYAQKQHCTLMCRCGVKCVRQWKSCNCTNGRCAPATCDCAKHMRECIPGICISCDAGGQTGRPCDNTRMQHLVSKPVEIKCGSHGLGAFACQNMNPGAFLGTYVGHIISQVHADSMIELAKHTSYNYVFEVTPDADDISLPMFDAAHLGNATRFLNHRGDDKDNVEAKAMLVIGEHQIGFFTKKKVKAGKELFLDYGGHYWGDTKL